MYVRIKIYLKQILIGTDKQWPNESALGSLRFVISWPNTSCMHFSINIRLPDKIALHPSGRWSSSRLSLYPHTSVRFLCVVQRQFCIVCVCVTWNVCMRYFWVLFRVLVSLCAVYVSCVMCALLFVPFNCARLSSVHISSAYILHGTGCTHSYQPQWILWNLISAHIIMDLNYYRLECMINGKIVQKRNDERA